MMYAFVRLYCYLKQKVYTRALTDPQWNRHYTYLLNFPHSKYYKYSYLQKNYPIKKQPSNIVIFYHVAPIGIHWRKIVDEQISTIIESGLYDLTTKIYYGCNGALCDDILSDYFKKYDKFEPLSQAIMPYAQTYENLTVNAMINKAKTFDDDTYCLYIHSKGVSNMSSTQHGWRQFMMKWLVAKHKMCIDLLNRGFHTIGTLFIGYDTPHYSGNFFWASSEYLKKVPLIEDLSNRYEAEMILLKKRNKGSHVSITDQHYMSYDGKGLYVFEPDMRDYGDVDVAIF